MNSRAMPEPLPSEQRTTRDRILDCAIAEFGERGVDGTSLKVIAEAAGVSQALIVHHFTSKQRLRRSCDEHIASTISQNKRSALAQGMDLDPLAALRQGVENRDALRYLARTVGDGTPEVARLIDEMVDDAVEYMAEGERTGLIKPSEFPRDRVVVLVLWSLGLLALHQHAERLLGIDLLGGNAGRDGTSDPAEFRRYLLPAIEMLAGGVLRSEMYEQAREAFARLDGEEAPDD